MQLYCDEYVAPAEEHMLTVLVSSTTAIRTTAKKYYFISLAYCVCCTTTATQCRDQQEHQAPRLNVASTRP